MKFSLLKLRKKLNKHEVEAALVLLSKSNSGLLFIEKNKSLVDDILFALNKNQHFSFAVIHNWLEHKEMFPPLELLWILEAEELLKISTYLYFHPEYCGLLTGFLCNTLAGEIDETKQNLIKNKLSNIVKNILIIRNNNDFKFLYEEVIENFVFEAIKSFGSFLSWDYFSDLKTLGKTSDYSLKEFALFHLKKLLNWDSNSTDLAFVIGNHTKLYSSEKLPELSKTFLCQLISILDHQEVITEIENVLHQRSFSWKNLLFLISVFVGEHKNAELLKGKVEKWLLSALEEKDKSLLFITLIVARHCCHKKARYFVNYPSWYGSLPLKGAASFSFFFESLSQIVPDEPPLYLKIHVNKVPSVPPSCQARLLDYLALAKTRLSDLNETTDYIGLFNDYHETDEEGQESDVQRAIKLFQETKEIPKPLIEASVFRKQYYEKTFLKRLLSLSEHEDEKRAELIKKLYSVRKIPSVMYRTWSSSSLSHY